MTRPIMEVMQENVDPVSTSNALYELMVDWRSCVVLADTVGTANGNRKYRTKRKWTETVLSRFFGVPDHEMRSMLEQHFDVVVKGGPRG